MKNSKCKKLGAKVPKHRKGRSKEHQKERAIKKITASNTQSTSSRVSSDIDGGSGESSFLSCTVLPNFGERAIFWRRSLGRGILRENNSARSRASKELTID